MQIVLTTPTGNVGRHVVRSIVRAGVRPRVIVRDAAKLDRELAAVVDVAEGQQDDVDFVIDSTAGADALFWVTPPTDDDDPLDGYARMADSVSRAVAENRISRTVFQSSVGAEKRHGAGEIDGLAATEERLDDVVEKTGVSVLHLRCGYFFSNLLIDPDAVARGALSTAMSIEAPMPWVDPRDIAEVAAGRLLSTDWSGRQVQAVHGPADLSFSDVAEILTEVLGHRVRAEQITDDDLRAALQAAGMSRARIDALVGMSSGLRENFVPEQERSVLSTTPSTLRSWAAEHLSRPWAP